MSALTVRTVAALAVTLTVWSCGRERADTLSDVNGVLMPCREVGRVSSYLDAPSVLLNDRPDQRFTTVEFTWDGLTVGSVVVRGRPPARTIGRRVKICDDGFLVVGRRGVYPIVEDDER